MEQVRAFRNKWIDRAETAGMQAKHCGQTASPHLINTYQAYTHTLLLSSSAERSKVSARPQNFLYLQNAENAFPFPLLAIRLINQPSNSRIDTALLLTSLPLSQLRSILHELLQIPHRPDPRTHLQPRLPSMHIRDQHWLPRMPALNPHQRLLLQRLIHIHQRLDLARQSAIR